MKNIAVIYLAILIFSFLHSELGLMKNEWDDCANHDICLVLENSGKPSKIIQIPNVPIFSVFLISVILLDESPHPALINLKLFVLNPLSLFLKSRLIFLLHTILI
ncbi:MAG: hypothetical protein NT007_08640 [Candidatus Kapabacteria bacterium]|nr:hypothetical protein [Candidatus Kapabacteria bacterium]